MSKTKVRKTIAIRATGLRGALDERGIRYVWLARKLGISKSHMSGLIAGRYNVQPRHAEHICELLNVPFFSTFAFIDRSESPETASGPS